MLPRTKRSTIYVYPDSTSEIGTGHNDSFREVVQMFKEALENERLRYRATEITYELKRCGPSPEKSHPSIVVCCMDGVYSDLEELLIRTYLIEEYYLPDPSRFPKVFNVSHEANPGADRPRFKIYFDRGSLPITLLWRGGITGGLQIQLLDDTESLPWSNLTMCGSELTCRDGYCATLA
ncbi:hypothetical protein BDW71DRAFT_82691 [Aspergillus fruticulosus]